MVLSTTSPQNPRPRSPPDPNKTSPPGPLSASSPGPLSASSPGPNETSPPGPNETSPPGPLSASSPGPLSASSPGPNETSPPGPLSLKGEGEPDFVCVTRNQRVSHDKRQTAIAFRKHCTPAEAAAWALLRTRPFGLKWRRQQVLHGFIVDFYCPALRLALEVDGSVHHQDDVQSADAERTSILEGFGIRVMRVTNDNVEANCIRSLSAALQQPKFRLPLALQGEGAGG